MLKTFIFEITKDFKYLGIPLKDQKIKKGIIIGAILKDNKVVIPNGTDVLLEGDKIFTLSQTQESIKSIMDIYR